MPFKSFSVEIEALKSKCVYTAVAGDKSVTICSRPLPGQMQASNGYNFTVGGPELDKDPAAGLFRLNGEWTGSVSEGDEIWVGVPEKSAWTDKGVPLTVLVWSGKQDKDDA